MTSRAFTRYLNNLPHWVQHLASHPPSCHRCNSTVTTLLSPLPPHRNPSPIVTYTNPGDETTPLWIRMAGEREKRHMNIYLYSAVLQVRNNGLSKRVSVAATSPSPPTAYINPSVHTQETLLQRSYRRKSGGISVARAGVTSVWRAGGLACCEWTNVWELLILRCKAVLLSIC